MNSAQRNVLSAASDVALVTVKMWVMVVLTGIGAGITSGLLMRLIRLVQHLSFSYSMGDFLTGVRNTSSDHRILVVSLGGVLAGLSLYTRRRTTGGSGAEVTCAPSGISKVRLTPHLPLRNPLGGVQGKERAGYETAVCRQAGKPSINS